MNIVKEEDQIIFRLGDEEYKYKVLLNHLGCKTQDEDSPPNSIIFTKLGMNENEKYSFCSDIYGYQSRDGNCPTYQDGDFEAATRLIQALQMKCNEYNYRLQQEHEEKA